MAIQAALTHRCDIRRATVTLTDGAPRNVWLTVAFGVPCLVTPDEVSMDPSWTPEQAHAASLTGTALFAPGADIRPGDVIVLTRPPGALAFSVGQDVRPVLDQRRVHHWEASVTQTVPATTASLSVVRSAA